MKTGNNGRFALTRYWSGYRAARDTAQACGLEWAREIVTWGALKGKSPAYIKGYLRYIDREIRKERR